MTIFNKKNISMPLGKYFKIKNPTYVYLRLKPHSSNRNYDTAAILKAVHSMYKSLYKRIYHVEKVWIKEAPTKCSYLIDIQKNSVNFYFLVSTAYKDLIKNKIREVWPKIQIEELDSIPSMSNNSIKYELSYKNEDGLSLNVDKKSNSPLNQILNVLNIMRDDDRIMLFYNFYPIDLRGWSKKCDKTIDNLKNGIPADKDKFTIKYATKVFLTLLIQIVDAIVGVALDVLGSDVKKTNTDISLLNLALNTIHVDNTINELSKKKRNSPVIATQMVVISDSKNTERKINNALSVCQSFNCIQGDNELIYKKISIKLNINPSSFKINGVDTNILSIDECQNLVQLPGKTLLNEYKVIDKIDVMQAPPIADLSTGSLRAGLNIFRGHKSIIYHTEHKELRNTAVCITGPNRSGKTTYLQNLVYDAIKDGRTVIIPDFCGKCKLSDELAQVISKDKILNIECDNWDKLQGFGWNEITPQGQSMLERYDCAKIKSARLKELINLVNDDSNDLEGRMERYLEYAALIVFISNGPVNDVFKVLKNHTLRHQYIDKIPKDLKEELREYVEELCEIDELQTKGDNIGEVIGTKSSHVSAILSRVHRLKQNTFIELMLKKDTKDNINLLEEMQKGKLICIRMYDKMFATQQQKDIYTCYWITKIWGALQKRYCDVKDEDTLVQTIILIDELYQTKNCEKYLTKILSQIPKYRAKVILSCHHLMQIATIQEELKSASCSYMFIRGSNKKNFNLMKEEFEDKGFTLEDLLHLKEYEALCLLTYADGYWAGIIQLPPPICKK